ncbi:MAG: purine-nucleoside phosphorylase [Kiritimatiellae bacterium]|jgi:purine-nucleoside phosphorylase|nr:purine-nucleoside phosphorylase [Kiritimatiellia bacterium]
MNTECFNDAEKSLPEICFERAPDCGLILGSGWSRVIKTDTEIVRIPYSAISGLGASTVAGHTGEMLLFERHGKSVVAFMGRRHWYEGQGWEPVILPVELMRRMGVQNLLITNAAGGINSCFNPGDLMIIRDHINTAGLNPLIGEVVEGWGERFPDQSNVYTTELIELLRKAANESNAILSEGVYAFTTGPSYETPAEIRAYASMGADAVGMSTVPEATVASAAGIKVAALSCITNMAAGISGPHLSHTEVIEQTKKSAPVMSALVDGFLKRV